MLPPNECRYAVYDHEFKTADGRQTDKLFFIFWGPTASHQVKKMEYTTERAALRSKLSGVFDVSADSLGDLRSSIAGDGKGGAGSEDEDEDGSDDGFDF